MTISIQSFAIVVEKEERNHSARFVLRVKSLKMFAFIASERTRETRRSRV